MSMTSQVGVVFPLVRAVVAVDVSARRVLEEEYSTKLGPVLLVSLSLSLSLSLPPSLPTPPSFSSSPSPSPSPSSSPSLCSCVCARRVLKEECAAELLSHLSIANVSADTSACWVLQACAVLTCSRALAHAKGSLHAHTRTNTRTHTLTHTHSQPRAYIHTHARTHARARAHTHIHNCNQMRAYKQSAQKGLLTDVQKHISRPHKESRLLHLPDVGVLCAVCCVCCVLCALCFVCVVSVMAVVCGVWCVVCRAACAVLCDVVQCVL